MQINLEIAFKLTPGVHTVWLDAFASSLGKATVATGREGCWLVRGDFFSLGYEYFTMPRFRKRRFRRKRRMRARRRFKPRVQVDPERKVITTLQPTFNITITGLITHLNFVAQGVSELQRIGVRAKFLSYQLRAVYVRQPGLGASATLIRTIVLIDHRPNQVQLTAADYLGAATTPIESPRNLLNNKRFTVLCDKMTTLFPAEPTKMLRLFFKLGLNTTWIGALGGINSISQGALYLMQFSDAPVLADAPFLTQISRLRFVG